MATQIVDFDEKKRQNRSSNQIAQEADKGISQGEERNVSLLKESFSKARNFIGF